MAACPQLLDSPDRMTVERAMEVLKQDDHQNDSR